MRRRDCQGCGDEGPRRRDIVQVQREAGRRAHEQEGRSPAIGPAFPISRAILPDSRDRELRQTRKELRRQLGDVHSDLSQSFRRRAFSS